MARIKFDFVAGALIRKTVCTEIQRIAFWYDMTCKLESNGGLLSTHYFVTMECEDDEKAKAAYEVVRDYLTRLETV